MQSIIETLSVPVREGVDVIVVGGGIAGVAAAVAARRNGASVLLLEKQALLGGLATGGLISWYEPLCDGKGEQLMFGLPEELLRLAIRYGDDSLPSIWKKQKAQIDKRLVSKQINDPIGGRYATLFSPTMFQLALDELLEREQIQIRLDILAVRPMMDKLRCTGVCCESISGREFYPAKVVVDATGDADMLYRAGAPCEEGRNYFSMVAHLNDTSAKPRAIKLRRWDSCGSDLSGNGHPANKPTVAGTTNEEVTAFLLDGRKALLDKLRNDDRTQRDVVSLPSMPQFRTIRHLCGAATLRESDCCVRHEDSIALVCDFERPGDWYEIPWGCLFNDKFGNMLAAGRMVSAQDWGWEVTRVIPVCAATGEAAGTAAALMAQHDVSACELCVNELKQKLTEQGVRLHFAKKERERILP
ncbi:MAG: FAD-dependent oxidoreductase [Eubacteriales bacterium]|nr:FAD-dependent oxidoreductase [Eubacteriales bacterium]